MAKETGTVLSKWRAVQKTASPAPLFGMVDEYTQPMAANFNRGDLEMLVTARKPKKIRFI
jgi:hypothetical protein